MWLIDKGSLQKLKQYLTKQENVIYEAADLDEYKRRKKSYYAEGSTAVIPIEGLLTKEPDFFAEIFYGANTSYSQLQASILEANADSSVDKIRLDIDSPGGEVRGLFETIDALQNSKKRVEARVVTAASAAYALASQAETITAEGRGSRVGSIGVVASFYNDPDQIDITSTEAPNKRPDITSEAGKDTVRAELDEIHDLFVEAIAMGRETTSKVINQEYGRGSTFLADKALERGMIDSISGYDTSIFKGVDMNLSRLKDEHPELFAEVFALGKAEEHERVKAHLILGEASGAMKLATDSITNKVEMSTSLHAEYLAAGLNKRDIDNRATDSAACAVAEVTTASTSVSFEEQIVNAVAEKLGL